MMQGRATADATQLLKHYVSRAWEAAGLSWNSDNEAEVDAILEPIRELEQRVEALERSVRAIGSSEVLS